jgi:hypothetical protein
MPFKKNVFINCPFDKSYQPLLRPLIFCVLYLGFNPRITLESLNSGEVRIEKIISLIENSKYGIHDLSRLKAKKTGEFFRLNMPFELGLDIGCRKFKKGKWKNKKILVMEKSRYDYQAALSDIAGSDIRAHKNDGRKVVSIVRDWLNNQENLEAVGSERIWGSFTDYMAWSYEKLRAHGYSPAAARNLEISELIRHIKEWLRDHPVTPQNRGIKEAAHRT